jgi:hypothetical protein
MVYLADCVSWAFRAFGPRLLCVSALVATACSERPSPEFPAVAVSLDSLRSITTRGGAFLVDPADATVDDSGRLLVTDRGDKVLKVLSFSSEPAVIGRAGKGPGEFEALVSGGIWDGTAFGYDLIAKALHRFGSSGEFLVTTPIGAEIPTPLMFIRVSEDMRLLGTGWLPPNAGPAVHLFSRDGNTVRSFFRAGEVAAGLSPRGVAAMGVLADVREGRVFVAMFGHDTLIVFDTLGKTLAAMKLRVADPVIPLLRLPERAAANDGSLRRSDGSWVQEGTLAVRAVVALPNGLAAIQLAPVDFSRKHDLLADGGRVLIVQYVDHAVRIVHELMVPGALLGRDRLGNGIVLRWRGSDLGTLDWFSLSARMDRTP